MRERVARWVLTLVGALSRRRLRLPAAAFVTGQIGDALTTRTALASGNFAEANPLFAPALATHHLALAMGVKLGLALLVLLVALTRLADPRRQVVLLVLAFISLEAPATNGLRLLGVL